MFVTRTVAVFLLCATLAVGETGAVLSASGTVLVNGLAATSSAIMPGDNVRTGETAFTSVTQTGSNVVLAKTTTGTFEAHKLLLHQGSTSIATANAYSVQAGSYLITPQASSARYEVARFACRISITAHDVPLTISDGTVVAAGHSTNRMEPNCIADDPNTGPPPVATGGAGISRAGLIAAGAVAAGGGAGLGYWLSSSEPKASPSRPSR